MPTYLIAYEISPTEDGTDAGLTETIKEQGRAWRQDDASWVVVSDRSAAQIRDALVPHLKPDDQLLVVREDREAAWAGFGEQGNDWPSRPTLNCCAASPTLRDLPGSDLSLPLHETIFADGRPRISWPG